MVQCKTILYVIGCVLLLFFGIPIRIDPPSIPGNDTFILFENYVEKYNKSYQNNQTLRIQKFTLFQNALKEINNLNSEREYNTSAIFGVTKFSDMSKEEFTKKYLQTDMYTRIQNNTSFKQRQQSTEDTSYEEITYKHVKRSLNSSPRNVDWRIKKTVTKINNQKNCGACWAFSALETVESMRAIKYNILEQLSVQELIDCAGYNNDGCNGGDICTLLYWLHDNGVNIEKEQQYPLHLKTETCKLDNSVAGVQISDFICQSYVNQEDMILYLLANHGPVAVAINAMLWQNYLGGVIHYHCDASPRFLNHAVQIVGYNLDAEIPYYIVRNSWGVDFGEAGYLYIAIGSNVCGLAHEVVSLNVV